MLRKITDSYGRVFRPYSYDYILIEGLFKQDEFVSRFPMKITPFLQTYDCHGPEEARKFYENNEDDVENRILLDVSSSCLFQYPTFISLI